MTSTRNLLIAGGIAVIVIIVGRIALATTFLGGNKNTLQNSVINPPVGTVISDQNSNNNQDSPTEASIIPDSEVTQVSQLEVENGILSVALPHFVDSTAIKKLNALINLDESINIQIEITQADSAQEYKRMLGESANSYDLILVPSIWIESFDEARSFPFNQDILALFHPSLSDVMNQQEMKRIPFAIDPFLTLTNGTIETESKDVLTWIDLEKALLKNTSPEQALLGFGIGDIDKEFIKKLEHPIPGYLDTTQLILASSIGTNQANFLFQLMETPFRVMSQIIEKTAANTSASCKRNAQVCLLKEGTLFSGFASMSEFLGIAGRNSSIQMYPLPDQNGLTAQGRGFISPNPNNSESVLARILGFIQEAPTSNQGLWNTTLPAFNTTLNQKLLETPYQNIAPFINTNMLSIPTGSLDLIETELGRGFQEVLDGDRRLDLYLE